MSFFEEDCVKLLVQAARVVGCTKNRNAIAHENAKRVLEEVKSFVLPFPEEKRMEIFNKARAILKKEGLDDLLPPHKDGLK